MVPIWIIPPERDNPVTSRFQGRANEAFLSLRGRNEKTSIRVSESGFLFAVVVPIWIIPPDRDNPVTSRFQGRANEAFLSLRGRNEKTSIRVSESGFLSLAFARDRFAGAGLVWITDPITIGGVIRSSNTCAPPRFPMAIGIQ